MTEPFKPLTNHGNRIRLEYLDGLRGIAAMYVVLYHTSVECTGLRARFAFRILLNLFSAGGLGVTVFIALSGYCLMLPVARRLDGRLAGGTWGYLKRRAWRILPPYYAALLITLLLIAVVPALHTHTGSKWDAALPVTWAAVVSHLLLVHDLQSAWVYRINMPMWSVATEWQIYFLFPILLWTWWRWGVGFSFALAWLFFISLWMLGHVLGHGWIVEMCPWHIVVFSMGTIGALLGFFEPGLNRDDRWRRFEHEMPWWMFAAVLLLLSVWVFTLGRRSPSELLMGAATSCFLVACTRASKVAPTSRRNLLLRGMESLPVLTLGTFSYSLYLMHQPIVSLIDNTLRASAFSESSREGILLFSAPVASICFASLFYRLFERPFLRGKNKTIADVARNEVFAPAP